MLGRPAPKAATDVLQMGMVAEPGGQAHQLVTATAAGELKFIDFRMAPDSRGKMGVYKTLQAHSKGSITAIVGHPYAPIVATGTTTQVSFHCWHAFIFNFMTRLPQWADDMAIASMPD